MSRIEVEQESPAAWFERTRHLHHRDDPSVVRDPVSGGYRPAGVPPMPSRGPEKPTGTQRLYGALADLEYAQLANGPAPIVAVFAGLVQAAHESAWQAGREGRQAAPLSRKAISEEAVGRSIQKRPDAVEFLRSLAEVDTDVERLEQAIAIAEKEYVDTNNRHHVMRLESWDRAFPGGNVRHVSDLRSNLHNSGDVAVRLRARAANLGRLAVVHERMSERLRKTFPTLVETAGGIGSVGGLLTGARKLRRVWADPVQTKELTDVEAALSAVKLDLEAISGTADVKAFADTLKRQQTALTKQAADLRSGIEGRALAYIQAVLRGSAEGDLKSWNLFMVEVLGAPGVFPEVVRIVVAEVDPVKQFAAQLLVEHSYESIKELEHIDA